MSGEPRAGFRQAWQHRQWRYLVASYAVSGIGDWLYFTAFVVWLYDRTGSAGWLGAASVVRMLVYVLFGAVGGAAAKRFAGRWFLVGLDVTRVGLMAALAIVIAADGAPAFGVALTALAAMATVPYRSAVAAATPLVVPESALAAANGAEAVVGQLSIFAGPALAAVVLSMGSPAAAIAINAGTFLVAALLISRVRALDSPPVPTHVSSDGSEVTAATDRKTGLVAELTAGWRVMRHEPGLWTLNLLVVVAVLSFGMEGILHVLVAERQLGRDTAFVGVLTAAIGVGGLVAAPLSGRVAASGQQGRWLIACAVLQGAPLMLLGVIESPVVAVIVLLVEGVGLIVFEVLAITLLQRLAGELIAPVYGIQDSMSAGAQLLGGIAAPVLVATVGLTPACLIGGGLLVGYGVVGAPQLIRCAAAASRRGHDVAPIVEVLAKLGLFEGASPPSLEAVARAIVSQPVTAGTAVVSEGEPADDLFVIRDGAFSAESAAHGRLRTMAVDDWFGEIGVVRASARTATVMAATDGMLWRIPGAAFLAAINDLGALPDPVRRGVASRLALTPSVTS